jgi:hypothetical protein
VYVHGNNYAAVFNATWNLWFWNQFTLFFIKQIIRRSVLLDSNVTGWTNVRYHSRYSYFSQ